MLLCEQRLLQSCGLIDYVLEGGRNTFSTDKVVARQELEDVLAELPGREHISRCVGGHCEERVDLCSIALWW